VVFHAFSCFPCCSQLVLYFIDCCFPKEAIINFMVLGLILSSSIWAFYVKLSIICGWNNNVICFIYCWLICSGLSCFSNIKIEVGSTVWLHNLMRFTGLFLWLTWYWFRKNELRNAVLQKLFYFDTFVSTLQCNYYVCAKLPFSILNGDPD
jgi:hypothetical protein